MRRCARAASPVTDITGSFVSIRDRLRTARALRASLLRRLELAVTDTAANAIQRRLEIVGNRISRLRGQLRDVRQRTEFATIFVELVDQDAGAVAGETDEALDDAVGSLEDILTFLISRGRDPAAARARRRHRLALRHPGAQAARDRALA